MTTLIHQTAVSAIVAARDASLARAEEAAALIRQAAKLLTEADDLAVQAHAGASLSLEEQAQRELDRFAAVRAIPVDSALSGFRRCLDGRIWVHLLTRTGMDRAMDAEARQKYRRMLAQEAPVVTEDAIWDSVEGAHEEAALYFRRGLANAFAQLDSRFKSHDAFKFNSRIILTNLFTDYGTFNIYHRVHDHLRDIERCFSVLAGDDSDFHGFEKELLHARGANYGGAVETRYFRVRGFKNGNAHLWVKDRALLDRVNLKLAAYYGEVLPDAVAPEVTPEDVRSKTGALSKDLAFYFTPPAAAEAAAKALWSHWDGRPRGDRVLEPSAGEGHLVEAVLDYTRKEREAQWADQQRYRDGRSQRDPGWDITVDAVEVHPGRVARLQALRGCEPKLRRVIAANFLQLTPTGDYDRVLMNPPFVGTHCLEHVMHAHDFLRPGGRLVAILPATAQVRETKKHRAFQAWLKTCREVRWEDLPQESFAEAGTRVQTVVLTFKRSA